MQKLKKLGFIPLLTFLFVVWGLRSFAQPNNELGTPLIKNYPPKTYKGAPQIFDLTQDENGILYFTGVGLTEYDGKTWRKIPPVGMVSSSITRGNDGRVYVGGTDDLGYLQPDSLGKQTYISLLSLLPEKNRQFGQLRQAVVLNQYVFFSSRNGYLIRYNSEKHRVRVWKEEQEIFTLGVVNQRLYIYIKERGLCQLNKEQIGLSPNGDFFEKTPVSCMLPFSDGKIVLGTTNQGLFLYDGQSITPFNTKADKVLKSSWLYTGIALPENTYALSVLGHGFVVLDEEGNWSHHLKKEDGLIDNTIASFHYAPSGKLWLGLNSGLAQVDITSPYTHFKVDTNKENLFIEDIIRHDDRLYVSSAGQNGVLYLEKSGSQFQILQNFLPSQSHALFVFDDKLYGTSALGIYEINKNQVIEKLNVSKENIRIFEGGQSQLDKDYVFLGLQKGLGFAKVTSDNWQFKGRFNEIPLNIAARHILETQPGQLWLATENHGIWLVNYTKPAGKAELVITEVHSLKTSSQNRALGQSLVYNIDGQMVFTGIGGIYTYETAKNQLIPDQRFPLPVPSTEILLSVLAETTKGDVIAQFSYTNGAADIGVYKKQNNNTFIWDNTLFQKMSRENIGNTNKFFIESNGIIWMGGEAGMIRFDSKKTPIIPDFSVEIREVLLNQDSVLYVGHGAKRTPILDAANNNIQFNFQAITFNIDGQNQYQTYLEGFDKQWSSWSPKSDKAYTNLPEGTYTFRVKSKNQYGQLSKEADYVFRVLPPWWRTWWAYVGYFLVGTGILYLFSQWRNRQLQQRSQALEQTVKERTKEIEQRVEELSVINSVQNGLAAQMDMLEIYTLVGNKIKAIFNAQVVVIRSYDLEKEMTAIKYAVEKGQYYNKLPASPFDAFTRYFIKEAKPLAINENLADFIKQFNSKGKVEGAQPKSALFVPLMVGKKVQGSVSLQNIDKENAFSPSDVNLLTTLSNSMSVALENARLFDETNRLLQETEQRAVELSTVDEISIALTKYMSWEALIQLVGDQMRALFKANIAYVAIADKTNNTIHFPYGYGDDFPDMKLGKGLTSQIILTKKSLLINQKITEAYDQLGIEEAGKKAASYLGVPIPSGEEVLGVISVQSTEQSNRFTEADERLLGTIAAHVGIALQNVRLFEEAEKARTAAEEASAAKSTFLSTVSHELRTPLTSVIGFAKIIKNRLNERILPFVQSEEKKTKRAVKQVTTNLDIVISEGERLTTLINTVLDLAKIEAGRLDWNMEPIQIGAVIQQATAATSALFEQKSLPLHVNLEEQLPLIEADKDRLIQVVINLISNAVKFTDDGDVVIKAIRKNGQLQVSVKDSGIGISKEDEPKVFEKFKQVGDTLTDKPKGTGLGLPICKEIVEHHKGEIWVESEIGVGSTFFFTLPITTIEETITPSPSEIVNPKQTRLEAEPLNGKERPFDPSTKTILVVDDEPGIRSMLRQEVTEDGYKVREATNGKEAVESIRQQQPDLVLLDVMMPEMNGFDVAAILKNDPTTQHIPIIVLSIVEDKQRMKHLGIDRYFTKPVDTRELVAEIGRMLKEKMKN